MGDRRHNSLHRARYKEGVNFEEGLEQMNFVWKPKERQCISLSNAVGMLSDVVYWLYTVTHSELGDRTNYISEIGRVFAQGVLGLQHWRGLVQDACHFRASAALVWS